MNITVSCSRGLYNEVEEGSVYNGSIITTIRT
ncbi:hypothetical protein SAMN05216389_101376 [Oceanobacillus limi]|uniref:Uncharacterized protein n=1 Tax=Oceanobacillus limi TaxID=930131 RepID=A0A1H9YFN2_9BACI|nr:hypothetical protein SAMN05216389_101376 [Oceanobacillus limi]